MKKRKFDFTTNKLDAIEGKYIGGFSAVKSQLNTTAYMDVKNKDCITTNNCNGANCVRSCGTI